MAGGRSRWRNQALSRMVLVLFGFCSSSCGLDSERGALQLRRLRDLSVQPRYGDCWARALQNLDASCRRLTAEEQSRLALRFTHCHLSSSGRDFPSCPEGSEVSSCTGGMDAAAFHAYTEFFTHTQAICHFLQSEAWQSRADDAVHRLTECSAGVAEQLESTKRMAEDLFETQSAALQAQQEILSSGEELRATLRDSTDGLRSVFSELSTSSREQQVALSELFNRVSFLQNFLLMEAHSLSSVCYNAAAFCASYLLTSTRRSSKARLLLLALVCLNFYLEKKIYRHLVTSDGPEHQQTEAFAVYVALLRRIMISLGVLVLLVVCIRYRDPVQQSLQVLRQLKETQRSLQEALQHAENLVEKKDEDEEKRRERREERRRSRRREELQRRKELQRGKEEQEEQEDQEDQEEDCSTWSYPSDASYISLSGWRDHSLLSSTINCSAADSTLTSVSHNAMVRRRSPARGPRHPGPSHSPSRSSPRPAPLVYSVQVEDRHPRYSLRNRRSDVR
ncbi:unnamed protein product [Ophioblennius macclurei]